MTPVQRLRAYKRIVLAYSGSANTTVAISWLAERYGAEVVTITLDVGQGEALEAVRDRACAAGAVRAHVIDVREEFARDFIVPALRAGAVGDDGDPLVTALSRPIIARHLVDVARLEGADAVAHGSPHADPDAQRFDALLEALAPGVAVLAPVRDWPLAPAEVARRARAQGLGSPAGESRDVDANLWGRAAQHPVDRPLVNVRDTYVLTKPVASAPDTPATVEVSFEEGVPVAVNGVELPLVELISSVETIAGAHGVGRIEAPAADAAGATSSLTIEAPAAAVLHDAHRALQYSVTPPELAQSARDRGAAYADLVTSGRWFTPEREAGDAFVAKVQKYVTGTACLKLFKGRSEVVACRSPFALSAIDPSAAAGLATGRS